MILSLNPTYFCNFRNGKCAETCYLTKEQLSNRQFLSIADIRARIEELTASFNLDHIDLYGGEVTILPLEYQQELMLFLASLDVSVNVVTNLSNPKSPFVTHLPKNLTLSVSWDFKARQTHEKVYERMLALNVPFSILSLGTPEFAGFDPEIILNALEQLPRLSSWEIKPYNQNQSNHHSCSHTDFERLIQEYILAYRKRSPHFELINIKLLEMCLRKEKSSWSDQHLYLTPDNHWSVLEFDKEGREYFKMMPSLDAYVEWAEAEKAVYTVDPHCQRCPYLGNCLSEHLKPIDHFETNGCSGFKNLIDWFSTSLPAL